MANMEGNAKIQWKEKFFYGMGDVSANILLVVFSCLTAKPCGVNENGLILSSPTNPFRVIH